MTGQQVWRTIWLGVVVAVMATACTTEDTISTTTLTTSTVSSTPTSPTATTAPPPVASDPRTPVVLDYSPTVSDIGALVFVASHPDLRLVAVTLPGTGESYCEAGVAHTRGVLEELGLAEIPVACGPEDPVTGWNAFPTSWRVASNQMDLPEADANETRTAPELLADVIAGSESPVEILAVGPLTNLAVAFEADAALADQVAGITIMGGAVDVPGNVFRNDVAEWNIWVDPTAAGMVFASGAPVTLVPLDATNHLPANTVFFEALDAAAFTPGSVLVRDLIAGDELWLAGGFYFWDELAAAVLADDSIVEFETRRLVVDDTERENKGWTREDPGGDQIRVATSADRLAFEQLYIDTLVGAPTDLGYLEATEADREYFEALEEITIASSAALDELLEGVAGDLGVDTGDDGAFAEVLVVAMPLIFAGPWMDRVDALAALDAPAALEAHHDAWVAALRAVVTLEDELTEAVLADDSEALDVLFLDLEAACAPIQDAAALRLLEVEFDCF